MLVLVDTFSSPYCSSKWNSKHRESHKIEMKPVSFLFYGEALNLEHFAQNHIRLVLMMKESIEFADSTQMKRRKNHACEGRGSCELLLGLGLL